MWGQARYRSSCVLGLLLLATAGCGSRASDVGTSETKRVEAELVSGVDLTITEFAPQSTVASRELVTFSWTVLNNGTTTAVGSTLACCAEGYGSKWADAIYLSTDATLSADDPLVGKVWRASNFTLASAATYVESGTLQMPTVAPGAYYLIAVTDSQGNRVTEANENNNQVAVPVTVTRADLSVTATVPATGGSQGLVTITWTVSNNGTGAASGLYQACCSAGYYHKWEDAAYLSTDGTLSADDIKFGSLLTTNQYKLTAGASYTATQVFQLPTVAPGSYQVLVVTDSAGARVDESNEDNNVAAAPITLREADLTVSALTAPGTAGAGELIAVNWTVSNQGSGAASGKYLACCTTGYYYKWEDAAYLSTDATLSADDVKFGSVLRSEQYILAAGSSYSVSTPFQLPAVTPGLYYLIVVADSAGDRVYEASESNNLRTSPITIGKPDLTITSANALAMVASQELVTVTWTVTNQGTGGASGRYLACCTTGYYYRWEDAVYLSTDATLSADDIKFGTLLRGDNYTLAAGASYTTSAQVQIPVVAAGSYYLLVVTDSAADRVPELSESNNTAAIAVTIGRADLAVTAVSAPTSGTVGQTASLSFTVSNQGNGGASGKYVACCASGYYYRWEDAVYLSTDTALSADDTKINGVVRGDSFTVAAGGSYTVSINYVVPTIASGAYYLLFAADVTGDRVLELSEANNLASSPFAVTRSDLAVATIGVPPNPFPGAPVSLSWTVLNGGAGLAAGSQVPGGSAPGKRWEDTIYLSADTTVDASDTLLRTSARADGFTLTPGKTYTASVSTVLPQVEPGSYYFLVVTDAVGNRVNEDNEGNNVLARAVTLTPPPYNGTQAYPGCDQFPSRTLDDNCAQNCCAEDDLCRVQNDCSDVGADSAACAACVTAAYECASLCIARLTDCATSPCGCGKSLCYSTTCAVGRTGYCATDCDDPSIDPCLQ
ncbi:CARDB domain-containing protein [Stigmatella sp. ncwal1]|uniref:CARDB domain-containing protein n=1 Tax=Stigmatella ashevillensis TaxID=2995309 RepID=A0ABT5DKU3_9BACT|nr:CARDB domain-containing protein [Stigmatella ashevillena]MDC0714214.1 CARDB domain-containing protein [Stigmatella ashevillena]